MPSVSEDMQEWIRAARLLVDSAYLLAEGFEPGENIVFSLFIIAVSQWLAEAAEQI